ncbi:hypothetical protein [Deinococcus aquaedulcis]|nr:hypothetical protein [Deinococcus aquaedulcis]
MSALTAPRFWVGIPAFSHHVLHRVDLQALLTHDAQHPGVFLLQPMKPFDFVRCGIVVLFLPAVRGRWTKAELPAQVLNRLLAFFAFLRQLDDLVFGELTGFHDMASLSSLRLGASLTLYFIPSSFRGQTTSRKAAQVNLNLVRSSAVCQREDHS